MYRDFANVQDMATNESASGLPASVQESNIRSGKSRKNCNVAANFPAKLHYMLKEIERDGLDHIVSWLPHGRCFMVHKQKEFERDILPL
jgi:HSF-type DNA-binding